MRSMDVRVLAFVLAGMVAVGGAASYVFLIERVEQIPWPATEKFAAAAGLEKRARPASIADL